MKQTKFKGYNVSLPTSYKTIRGGLYTAFPRSTKGEFKVDWDNIEEVKVHQPNNEPNQLAWQILGWTIMVALVGAVIWHAFKVVL